MPERGTSKYRGVYYSSPYDRWIVELERHNHYPCFFNERDAAIYAEYHYRELYGERPNFPDMSEDELACEYEKALTNRYMVQVKLRSTSKQGLKKIHFSASKYVRVDLSSREKDILDLCSPFMSAIAEAGKGKLVCIG